MARRVVVGWDGSTAAAGALEWAARHYPRAESVEIVEVEGAGRRQGRPHRDADEAAESIRQAHPDLTVTVSVERGVVSRVLADRSAPDGLVVLGGRGHEEMRLGHRTSTAYRVVLAARGPVAVVPQSYRGGRDVVVGVVGRSDARCVVLTAAAEAARRRQRLVAVHAARPALGIGALPGDPVKQARDRQEYDQLVQEVVAPVTDVYPDLPVVPRVLWGRPSDVLLGESRGAMLLVLGRDMAPPANGRPVTQSSMLLSRAPVMVVPPETEVPTP
jgi:nucleotide-binding universal stress UspA family protein